MYKLTNILYAITVMLSITSCNSQQGTDIDSETQSRQIQTETSENRKALIPKRSQQINYGVFTPVYDKYTNRDYYLSTMMEVPIFDDGEAKFRTRIDVGLGNIYNVQGKYCIMGIVDGVAIKTTMNKSTDIIHTLDYEVGKSCTEEISVSIPSELPSYSNNSSTMNLCAFFEPDVYPSTFDEYKNSIHFENFCTGKSTYTSDKPLSYCEGSFAVAEYIATDKLSGVETGEDLPNNFVQIDDVNEYRNIDKNWCISSSEKKYLFINSTVKGDYSVFIIIDDEVISPFDNGTKHNLLWKNEDTTKTAMCEISIDTTVLEEGKHTVRVVAYDFSDGDIKLCSLQYLEKGN